MPLLKKINPDLPNRIRGAVGMLVIFENGVAKVNRATATHFGQVPGFEIEEIPGEVDEPIVVEPTDPEAQQEIAAAQPTKAPEAPTEASEEGEITVESLEGMHWMTQKKLIEQGKVPLDVLMFIAENGVTAKVRNAANTMLGR